MLIVGLTGGIGHGKTTFGEYLGGCAEHAQNFESSLVISEVANDLRHASGAVPASDMPRDINEWLEPLPGILAERTRATTTLADVAIEAADIEKHPERYARLFDYTRLMHDQPDLQAMVITPANKDRVRPLLQWLGGYLVIKVSPRLWYSEIVRRIQATPDIELATVGGVRYQADADCLRDAGGVIMAIQRPELEQSDATDLTERERGAIRPDTTIINDADLTALKSCAPRVYKDLLAGTLAATYVASESTE